MTDRGWGRGAQDDAGPRAEASSQKRPSFALEVAQPKVAPVKCVFFLAGSSYPEDRDVEIAVTRRLNSAGIEVVSQAEILATSRAATQPRDPAVRVEQLRRAIDRSGARQPPFVIGRSSGAQTGTLASLQFDLAGVICLSYPFRPKGRVLEPARFAHLAHLRTPTLIIQGERDGYGGRGLTREYRLSPQVALRLVRADHKFELDQSGWDRAAEWILDFIACPGAGTDWLDAFDEDFYLATHPDVATWVEESRYGSGRRHFELTGQLEGRSYRLLTIAPEGGGPTAPAPSLAAHRGESGRALWTRTAP